MGGAWRSTPTAEIRRRHALHLLSSGFHLFDVARSFAIAPRVLLAWINFEGSKWENDPYEGRGPGPDEHYVGDWPTEKEEFEEYRRRGVAANDISDKNLRARYLSFLKELKSRDRGQANTKTSPSIPNKPKSRKQRFLVHEVSRFDARGMHRCSIPGAGVAVGRTSAVADFWRRNDGNIAMRISWMGYIWSFEVCLATGKPISDTKEQMEKLASHVQDELIRWMTEDAADIPPFTDY